MCECEFRFSVSEAWMGMAFLSPCLFDGEVRSVRSNILETGEFIKRECTDVWPRSFTTGEGGSDLPLTEFWSGRRCLNLNAELQRFFLFPGCPPCSALPLAPAPSAAAAAAGWELSLSLPAQLGFPHGSSLSHRHTHLPAAPCERSPLRLLPMCSGEGGGREALLSARLGGSPLGHCYKAAVDVVPSSLGQWTAVSDIS